MVISADLDRASLERAQRCTLERLVDRLGDELRDELVAVWLYGSRARGEASHAESDVDLLIVTRSGSDEEWRSAYRALYEIAQQEQVSPVDFSLKVVDAAWVDERRAIGSFFIQEVDRDKLVLLGGS